MVGVAHHIVDHRGTYPLSLGPTRKPTTEKFPSEHPSHEAHAQYLTVVPEEPDMGVLVAAYLTSQLGEAPNNETSASDTFAGCRVGIPHRGT